MKITILILIDGINCS